MSNQRFSNRAASVLFSGISSGALSLTVATGEGAKFPDISPALYYFRAVIQGGDADVDAREFIRVTARAGDVFTIERAQEGSTALAWSAGATIAQVATAASFDELEGAITPGSTAQYWRGDKTWRDFATDVRAAVLTGFVTSSSAAVAATDNLLVAIGKLQGQLNNLGNAILAQTLTGLSLASSAAITATDTVLTALGRLQAQVSLKYDKAGGAIGGKAYTTVATVAGAGGNITLDVTNTNVVFLTLTSNPTIIGSTGQATGQTINARFDNGAAVRAYAWDINLFKLEGVPATSANRVNWLVATWTGSRWEGAWSPVPV